jgi:hypothetical protein
MAIVTADHDRLRQGDTEDICMRIPVRNAAPEAAGVLPTLWFRNRWSWEADSERLCMLASTAAAATLIAEEEGLGRWRLAAGPDPTGKLPELLFCENGDHPSRLYGTKATTQYPKDGITDHVVAGAPRLIPRSTERRWRVGTTWLWRPADRRASTAADTRRSRRID